MQTRFRHQNKPFCIVIGMKSIATKLFYQHTPIDTAIYEKFVCYNHKTKYTDVPYQMTVGGAFVYVCERDHVIDFEQWSRVYITRSVIMRVFSRGPRRPRNNGVAV